ncbi:hypothetical protein ACL02R_18250 [Streptomyces sp. MS19]|uniref:hypothetical protein n=1 Tax=Streptomyces sp. MS19 TaxID=3385972 RepID=UPI0039A14FBA
MGTDAAEGEGRPTRSPHRLDEDEGPQSIAELKAALAPWPGDVDAFSARLETVAFPAIGELIAEYRTLWLARVHPALRQAARESEDATTPVSPWDEVMADYDEDFALRPDAAVRDDPGRRTP